MSNRSIEKHISGLVEAHIQDAKSPTDRYVNTNLKEEIKNFPNFILNRHTLSELEIITRLVRKQVLACPHPTMEREVLSPAFEKCRQCQCSRFAADLPDGHDGSYYTHSESILETYTTLTPEEKQLLEDFINRNLNLTNNNFKPINQRMIAIFNKYPLWNEWQL